MEKNKEDILYTCESILDAYEYRKIARYFPEKLYWKYIGVGTIINIILTMIVVAAAMTIVDILIFAIVLQAFIMIFCKIRLEFITEKVYSIKIKKGSVDTDFNIEFYDEYFTIQSTTISEKINYSDIDRCIEAEDEYYLEYKKTDSIFIIQKTKCNLELVSFIRDSFDNYENHLGDRIKFKGVKKK